MEVTQYIGARYVPVLADPVEWSSANAYEPLTIVLYQGNSYTSRQAVPVGVAITNEDFWACTGNYNAQIESYRQEVARIAGLLDDIEDDVSDAKTAAQNALAYLGTGWTDVDTVRAAIDALNQAIGTLPAGTASVSAGLTSLAESINGLGTDVSHIETTLTGFDSTHQVKTYVDESVAEMSQSKKVMVVIGDSFTSDYYINDSNLWYHAVADTLNCDAYNYSERGSGYLNAGNEGHTFLALAQEAESDTRFDNADVAWLFVYGGLNDIDHANAGTAFSTNLTNFCNYVSSTFPNAQLVVCGINAWKTGFSFYNTGSYYRGQMFYERLIKQQNALYNAHAIFISMCCALGFNEAYYSSANNHPNDLGQSVIASWILSALFGCGLQHSVSATLANSDDTVTGGTLTLHVKPGLIAYSVQVPSSLANTAIKDTVGFFKGQDTDLRGQVIATESGGDVFGWLGAKDSNGLLNVHNFGFGRGVVAF